MRIKLVKIDERDKTRCKEKVGITGRGIAVLTDAKTGKIKQIIKGENIVSNIGDTYYTQMGAGETPDNDFTAGGMKLGTGTTDPTKSDADIETDLGGSYKALYAGFPQSNDVESGGGAVNKITYKCYWSTAEANAVNINECVIVTDNGAPPAGLLCRLEFAAPFTKTSAECLTVYILHEMLGA